MRHLRQDSQVIATTMVDYYGMPERGQRAWPGRNDANGDPGPIETAMAEAIRAAEGHRADRFIPFVVMHEFEGLLFSDCRSFASGVGKPSLHAKLQSIHDTFGSPEDINDHPSTHPAQRVLGLMPEYDKPLHGTLAASRIGLDAIRAACAHLRQWLERLEACS